MSETTFSESWHRVAGQRVCLQPAARVRRQNFRGERWFVIENPFTNEFFRLTPDAYEFIVRLHPSRTVDEVWRECLERFPARAPGQSEVLQLLSQLYFSNLLRYDRATDAAGLFERFKKRQRREWQSRLLNLMFTRFPLFDPDRFLVRALPVVGRFFSPFGALLWLVVVGWGLKVVADNWDAARQQSEGILAPANLPLLYVGMAIIKAIHELGHAFCTRKLGGEVHVMGVMLMIFTPVPYVDATAAWSLRSRWQRILVGSAGMIVELFFAALAVFLWAATGQGLLHSLAYNIMFVASVSTVVFNANPLLRFDGYYILSDLLEIPNLSQRSMQYLRFLAERWFFGLRKAESPARTRREAAWLPVFGLASGVYRVIVFGGILLVVADHFFLIGIVMAAVCFVSWVTVPAVKFVRYLAASPRLDRHRPRAIAVSIGLLAVIVGVLQFLPLPSHFRAPGVLQARQWTQVVNEAAGTVAEILALPGDTVRAGQALVRFESPELAIELAQARANYLEIDTRLRAVLPHDIANLKPLRGMLESASNHVAKLESDVTALTVRARHDGRWVAPELMDSRHRWLPRGTPLGLVIDPASFQFTSTVKQEEAAALFRTRLHRAEIRLFGQVDEILETRSWSVIPGSQRVLPSPALGWHAGGEVATAVDDPKGLKAAEPFFEVRASVPSTNLVAYLHGRSGKIRFDADWEPLLPRWIRSLRQLLQKRYQL